MAVNGKVDENKKASDAKFGDIAKTIADLSEKTTMGLSRQKIQTYAISRFAHLPKDLQEKLPNFYLGTVDDIRLQVEEAVKAGNKQGVSGEWIKDAMMLASSLGKQGWHLF